MALLYLGDFGFADLRNAAFYSDVIVHLDFLGCWFPGGPEKDCVTCRAAQPDANSSSTEQTKISGYFQSGYGKKAVED